MVGDLEALPAAFMQNSNEVDDGVVARDESLEHCLVVDRDVDEADLADIALQLEEFTVRTSPRSASRLTT